MKSIPLLANREILESDRSAPQATLGHPELVELEGTRPSR